MKYLSEYQQLHIEGKFQGNTLLHYRQQLDFLRHKHNVKSVLDYGCGKAQAWRNLPLPDRICLYDPAVPKHDLLPKGTFDLVVCCDVLEHVPELELYELFTRLFHYADKAMLLTFCNRPAKKTFSDGTNVHVTQKDHAAWMELINRFNHKNIDVMLLETK